MYSSSTRIPTKSNGMWWGKGPIPFPDMPTDETSIGHVYHTQEPLHIADWSGDDRFLRLKQLLQANRLNLGSLVRVPLTTAHRC